MALDRDGSSIVLLSVNGKPVENNNMLESDTFQPMEYELKPNPVKVKKWARLPFIIAWICVACAVAFTIAAVVLVVRHTGSKQEINQTIPISYVTTISPSSSTSTSSNTSPTSPPIITIQPSFSSTTTDSLSTSSSTSSTTSISSSISSSISTNSSSAISVSISSSVISSSISSSVLLSTSTTTIPISSTSVISTTTTIPATTTTPKPCDKYEFQCSDGSCISEDYFCDGKPHCPLSEDEPANCTCSSLQFECSSGQCIAERFYCDGTPQCLDKSDEMNCTGCTGFECGTGQCLWTSSVQCNYVVDCDDLSDEMNCGWRPYIHKCTNGVEIHRNKVCDGVDDCFDNSDEEICDQMCNSNGERVCGDFSTCILHEWFCDGFKDCPDGSDEAMCGSCADNQHQCSDYSCINSSQVCDGRTQCPSGSDELDCVKLHSESSLSPTSGVVMVTYNNQQLPVCSDSWNVDLTNQLCSFLGQGTGTSQTYVAMETLGISGGNGFMGYHGNKTILSTNETVLSLLSHRAQCTSNKVVKVSCTGEVCGTRQVDFLSPFVVGGTLPPLGKWPWVVALSLHGKYVCSGVLVDHNWILTAAHCIVTADANYTLVPQYYSILMGAISVHTPNSKSQTRQIEKIILHPQTVRMVTHITDWDMALLHFREPVSYSDYIQPICLPSQDNYFPSNSQCYLTGWGLINPNLVTIDKLREAKMRLWSDEECRSNTVDQELYVNTNSTLCAGYHSGLISACQGDSGGPLVCRVATDHWVLAGVVSSGQQGCDGQQVNKANRFAKISSSADWIHSVIHR